MDHPLITGFSRLEKSKKLQLASEWVKNPDDFIQSLKSFWHRDDSIQAVLDELSENTLSTFPMPFGVAPNFVVNDKLYLVPMVIEESSVVAAASKSAKFFATRGGFHARVVSDLKNGSVYFEWKGSENELLSHQVNLEKFLKKNSELLTRKMEERGGGIRKIRIESLNAGDRKVYHLKAAFGTDQSMGANFINTCLEHFAVLLPEYFKGSGLAETGGEPHVVMAILSNYTPECRVLCYVECPFKDLDDADEELSGKEFARKFKTAVDIARHDVYRATTHNKGIFNGIDAVVMATGNDFRAVEAAGHAWAARMGSYASLSSVTTEQGTFRFELDLPMALGTVGGLTRLHPLAKWSLGLLGEPCAQDLMKIAVAVGLANNFGAVRSLVTSGIQKGHMKMHLSNILASLDAKPREKEKAQEYFKDKTVSYREVEQYLDKLRKS